MAIAANSSSKPSKEEPPAPKEASNKEHLPNKEASNSNKECLPNKELASEAKSRECMPPRCNNSSNPKEEEEEEVTQVANCRSNTASTHMGSTEIPTWALDQGCGLVSIKVQDLLFPSLEEEEGGNLGNPQLWIVRDVGSGNRSKHLTRCTTLAQGGPSP